LTALALSLLLVAGLAGPAVAAPEGDVTWAVHVSLAPTWFDPAETPAVITPFMMLYALHDALVKPMPGGDNTPSLAGTWEMRRNEEEVSAPRDTRTWQVFLRQSGAEVSGTILRVDGDTGTLVGHWQDDKLTLSHFAGERPNLFEATLDKDGTLAVTLNGSAHYRVVRSSEARAKGIPEPPDPSRYTNVKDPVSPFHFAFPDLTGRIVSDIDPQLRGKVMILAIGGSWCPNCHDEAPFLVELYKKYKKQGLEIVEFSFEEEAQQKNPVRVRAFNKRYGIEYTVLIPGEPKELNDKLPQGVNLNSFPTTFFLGRDGRVRSAHAGFAGKASGKFHTELKEEVTALVERLLAEKPAQTSASK
jgi:thiol-disulfide isomerase/thioredoxin